jgi:CSLREA domain-containing protein
MPRAFAIGMGLALLLLAAAGVAAARPAHATTPITVDTLADGDLDSGATTCVSTPAGGKCTLRAAIRLNENNGGGGAITLNLPAPGNIGLTIGQLTITKNVAITGAGLATNAVVGDGKHRVFAIDSPGAQVAMAGFTITDGRAIGNFGGGIANAGALTLSGVDVQNNTAGFGGGIADAGTLTLQPGTIVNRNSARTFMGDESTVGGIGGGVAEFGKLVATGATFSGNTADDAGGNLAFDVLPLDLADRETVIRGTGNVTQSTITEGAAIFGGGAWIAAGESATFTASTFFNNASSTMNEGGNFGGAIESECGALTLTNDTLDQNTAAGGFGGAISLSCFSDDVRDAVATSGTHHPVTPAYDVANAGLADVRTAVAPSPSPTPAPSGATAAIDFVTMADNLAGPRQGSTIFVQGDLSTITVHDTIIAKKSGDPGKDCLRSAQGTLTSQGYNLESANDCGFAATGDQTGANPQLGALASNGGPTRTMALTAGTPAVDSADPKCDVTADQRGVSRPQGPRCDIGAFELQVATPATPTPLPSPPVTGQGPARGGPSLVALILALLALPLVGAGLLIARRRTA